MENYDTLSEGISALRQQGYTEDFNLKESQLECASGSKLLAEGEFEIDKSFRFDVNEDPSDQAVLYAISSQTHGLKGLLVNGFGLYSDERSNEILRHLGFH